ncbi:MAG: transglycosylase domain-containing protein, partial [Solirubrobacteraceae bacterium]
MTEDERTGYVIYGRTGRRRRLFRRRPPRRKMRWLRLLAIVLPLAFLALISFVFGMVVAVTPQLDGLVHALEVKFTTKNGLNTLIFSDAASGRQQIATLSSHDNQFFLDPDRVPAVMAHAIVSVEDKRFYTESGVDVRGIARAFVADIFGGSGTQGASTITEQFIKVAENAQAHRTILEKLKEAALAFQLAHHWKKQHILAEYLNTAYYGSGAYSLEAAAKAYFGNDPASNLYGCGTQPSNKDPASLCVTNLTADEAALLAAAVR